MAVTINLRAEQCGHTSAYQLGVCYAMYITANRTGRKSHHSLSDVRLSTLCCHFNCTSDSVCTLLCSCLYLIVHCISFPITALFMQCRLTINACTNVFSLTTFAFFSKFTLFMNFATVELLFLCCSLHITFVPYLILLLCLSILL